MGKVLLRNGNGSRSAQASKYDAQNTVLSKTYGALADLRRELADSKTVVAEREELLRSFAFCTDSQAAITSAMIFSSAPESEICFKPSRSTMTAAGSPVANIFGKTCLASLPESSSLQISLTSCPRCAALTGESAISLPSAFSRAIRSPITQLAAILGLPETPATVSKYSLVARAAVSTSASY